MKKIVFFNFNGGSGKTTLALGLAKVLLARQKTVAIIDLDPLLGNVFDGIPKVLEPSELYDFNLFDCPPFSTHEVILTLESADFIIIPNNVSCQVKMEERIRKYCPVHKTFIVPTYVKDDQVSVKLGDYPVTKKNLKWQVPVSQESLIQVCEELADSILGKTP